MSEYKILTYEYRALIDSIVAAIRPYLEAGEKIIWRAPFRWMDDCGVLPNHYDVQSLEYLAEEFGYEIVHNFRHVGVIKRK